MTRFSGVLLDLGGVVFVGNDAIEGAAQAVRDLREDGIAVRFLTNTTRSPRRAVVEKLNRFGIEATAEEVFTPAMAVRRILGARAPHLLVHPDLREDFETTDHATPEVVIVGDACNAFTYDALNAAFRILESGADLLALAKNRTFQDQDGALSLDAGPFVAALEYACGRDATVIGKPAAAFFAAAVASLGGEPYEVVMVGDDVESDVGGAMAAGLSGILVRTGKYKAGDEARIDPPPSAITDDLAQAVAWILADA